MNKNAARPINLMAQNSCLKMLVVLSKNNKSFQMVVKYLISFILEQFKKKRADGSVCSFFRNKHLKSW